MLSTGDELVQGAGKLAAGQIRELNPPALLSLWLKSGAEPVDLGTPDDADAIAEAVLEGGAETCDAILSSGGVSMGGVDLMRGPRRHR